MSKILSIIVPSYNVEKYIAETLKTLCDCNTLPLLDIIVVNDGSKDNTKHIAEEYQKEAESSLTIINKENGGHGSAINAALKIAKGKYVIVVDGDDWVDSKELDNLVQLLQTWEADVVILGHFKNYVNTGEEKKFNYHEPAGFICDLSYFVQNGYYLKMTDICFNLNLLRRIGLVIQEKTFYVDEEYCTIPCKAVKKIIFSGLSFYHYRIGDVNQSISIENTVKRIRDKERVFFNIYEQTRCIDANTPNCKYIEAKLKGLLKTILEVYYIYMPFNSADKKNVEIFWKKVKKQCGDTYKACIAFKFLVTFVNVLRLNEIYKRMANRRKK